MLTVVYATGGLLTGLLHFSVRPASRTLGSALSASISPPPNGGDAVSGDYDFATNALQLSLGRIQVTLPAGSGTA